MAYRNNRHFSCNLPEFTDQEVCESDQFHMYVYKIKKCSILRSHEWASCPFSHRGERARRRDLRKYSYLPIPCPGYKFASCIKGDYCELSHGIFECWLHPAKYRTQLCNAGRSCDRRVCFFAHTLNELRPETKYNWCYVYQYPLDIQPYPDILIENGPNGNWMVIPCNPQPPPPPPQDQYYGITASRLGNSSTSQETPQKNTSNLELFVPAPPFQSQPRIDQTFQNESDFSFFSTSPAKLADELKNLEIGRSSQVNKMHDEKGKRPMEFES